MALEYGDHAKHRVYYGKEGEPLQVRNLVSLARIQNVGTSFFMCTGGDAFTLRWLILEMLFRCKKDMFHINIVGSFF